MKRSKPTRPKLFYDGAHDGVVMPHDSMSDSLIPLEPRFMFDAAGVATGAEVAAEALALEQAEQAADNPPEPPIPPAVVESTEKLFEALSLVDAPDNDTTEIVFIDSSVEDYETLLEGIDSNAEVIFIDSDSDGVQQIAEALADRDNIDAIHIIAHGDAGELELGNTTLTQSSILGEHADELSVIKQALSEEADILIYGCNFAEGEFGQAAADSLGIATGADIAASEDLTGHESLGGDWDLEYEFGDVGTVTISAEAYEGILATQILSFVESTEVTGDGDTDGEVGEVFRFHNVAGDGIDANTPGTGGIDAIITITDLAYIDSTTGLAIGTDTPILEDWDRAGSGALDPVLDARTITGGAVQGSEISATFTIQYVVAGTSTGVKVDSFVSPIDVDSSANLREAVSVTAPVVSVIQNDPTSLTTDLTHANGLTTIALEQATLNNHNPGVTNTPEFAATFQVQQAEIFTVQIKSIIDGATAQTGERLFSLVFDETTFTTPNTLSVPIVDLDLNDSTGASDLDFQNASPYQVGDTAISIVDSDVTITDSDPDLTDMQSANIALTNAQAGDRLNADTAALALLGITALGDGTDTITLSGVSSIANYQDALKLITFDNTNALTTGISSVDRTIEITINNGDIDSPVATANIDVFGTPTVDTQITTDTQPTITGAWDIGSATTATGLQVTVDGTTYTLGTDAALTTDASGNWSLDLSVAGQTLPVAPSTPYNVSVSTTDGTNTVIDVTTDELTVILNPEWSFTGDIDVLEGDTATYTLTLVGAESLATGETIAVDFGTAGTATEGAANDYDLNQALFNAAGTNANLSYVPGSFTLIYTSPATPAALADVTISVSTASADGVEGTENYDLTITAGTGTNTSTVSTTANATNTVVYESLFAPTLTANPDGTTNFTEGDTNKDLFDSVVIDPIEATQTIDEIEFNVSGIVDGSNEVINIDGVAIPMSAGTGTTASGHTYLVTDNGGGDFTITLTTTGASSASIQTLVDDMSYRNNLVDTPTAGDRDITISSITDSGASNNTSALAITETVTVVAVNDAPVVGAPVLPLAYTAGMDIHGTGFNAADIDAGTATNLVVTLSSNDGNITVVAGNSGLTSITGSGSPTVTLTGTISQIDNYLRGLTTGTIVYTTLGGVAGDDTFTVSVNDMGNTGGGNLIGANSVIIKTTGNLAPALEIDTGSTTYGDDFTEGGPAVNITSGNVNLTDAELDDVTLQIVAVDIADGANEILNFGAGQIQLDGVNDATLNNQTVDGVIVDVFYDASTQTITITDQGGNALTLADATTVLEAITYQNDDGAATLAPDRTFNITADDGVVSNTAVTTISLINTENAPVNTIAAQTVNEDVLTSLTGISVNDTDEDIVSTTLTVTSGALNATDAGGGVAGNGSNSIILTGTQAQINAALATLQYQGDSNFNGTDTLTMVSVDADGGTADDTDIVNITVNSVNDAPVINAGNATDYPINEGATTSGTLFDSIDIDPIETTVPGAGAITAATIDITGTIDANDTLTINGTAITALNADIGSTSLGGGNSYSITGGTLTITFAANTAPDAAEAILNGITFTAVSGDVANHTTIFTLDSITDNGGTANGGSDTDQHWISVRCHGHGYQ